MAASFTIDLPAPPSVNAIWSAGRRRIYKSQIYVDWIHAATSLMWDRKWPRIKGQFEAHIVIDDHVRGDLDNRHKALLDWAQKMELISNDKHCTRLVLERGNAPAGCILTIKER